MRSRAGAVVLVALLSCGRGVDDLSLEAAPIALLEGRVELAALSAAAAGRPLRAALVWGAVPAYVTACLKYPTNPELQAACPDPFGFVPGGVAAEVEVGADGSFVIPIHRLPDASFAVGDFAARIAWGSVVVAADADGNGAFNLFAAATEAYSEPDALADPAVAASFFTLHEPQQRLAFREGGWDEESLFYPAKGCAPPPPGFSVLSTPGLQDFSLDPAPGDCVSAGLEGSTVLAAPLPEAEGKGLACRTLNRASVRRPGTTAPGADPEREWEKDLGKQLCLDAQTLAFVSEGDCPQIVVMPLAGCRGNLVCQDPDWDLTRDPPAWWPCAAQ